jgi:hypothetical protein
LRRIDVVVCEETNDGAERARTSLWLRGFRSRHFRFFTIET